MVYAFSVKMTLSSEEDRNKVTALLDNAAKAIKGKEREAKTYYFYRPEDDSKDKSIYGFEIYGTEKDVEEVHLKGNEFLALSKCVEGSFELDYFSPFGGFLTNSKLQNVNEPAGFIYWADIILHPGKKDEFMKLAKDIAVQTEKDEPECYTYLWLESTADANKVSILERYKTKESFSEIHFKAAAIQKFIKDIIPSLVEKVTAIPYVELCGYICDNENGMKARLY